MVLPNLTALIICLVIFKFTSYEPCRAIFTAKCKLKGTNVVITENLTRRRVDLLRKARASLNVIQPGVVRSIQFNSVYFQHTSTFHTITTTGTFCAGKGADRRQCLLMDDPPNIKPAIDNQYLLKQSLDCNIQPGVVRSTNIKYAVDSQYLIKQSLDRMIQPDVVWSS